MTNKKGEKARLKTHLIYVTSEQNKSERFKLWHLLQKVCVCVCSGLTDDVAGGLEGQLYNAFVLVRGGQVEDGEDILPA